ncbi:MAG: hypothetical protein LWW85_00370 [Marinilabiliales bacterium]|nr:hypothetical protein [Marinilabiliales bacterium]
MKKNQLTLAILLVGIAFATAWAIRGQFGHEPGAAMAGIVGGAALVWVAKRKDWHAKMLPIIASTAIGWGTTGMISYGMVVGYCRVGDLLNSTYGYLSLFVIGGLFGLIGGGLTGLSLNSSPGKRVRWATLFAEMVAGGVVGYFFLIEQAELLMTPPRSEAWAICLGAGVALVAYMLRNGFHSAFRVSFHAMLGAGFGFSFGNLLQTIGTVMELPFNMWNVMEYNIGFWGGCGMAYAVFTSEWPIDTEKPDKTRNALSLAVIGLIIPFFVWKDAFTLQETLKSPFLHNDTSVAWMLAIGTLLMLGLAYFIIRKKLGKDETPGTQQAGTLFITMMLLYIFWSYLITGLFMGNFRSEQPLYLVNLIAFLFLFTKLEQPFSIKTTSDNWYLRFFLVILVILTFSVITLMIHGGNPALHPRFGGQ